MKVVEPTVRMLGILHHTLGLRPDQRTSYRNHYVASPGHSELPNLRALEAAGLMKLARTPAFCHKEDMVFVCTDAGKEYAIDNLPPEPKRTKYDQFCRSSDCFESFAQFLGINKPKYEKSYSISGGFMYRMFRRDLSVSWAIYPVFFNDTATTEKEAKASYKEALKLRADRLRQIKGAESC